MFTQSNRTFCEGNGNTLVICMYKNKKSFLSCFRNQSVSKITPNKFTFSPIPSVKVSLYLPCITFTHSLTHIQIYFLTKCFQPTPTFLVYWSLLSTGLTYAISRNIITPALRYISLFFEICSPSILGNLCKSTALHERAIFS